jgi:hypothetical protein
MQLEIVLPIPLADVPGPALVAFVAADNVRLAPAENEQQGLTRPTVAPRMKLPAREQSPLFYRAEQPQAQFVAAIERLPQTVKAGVETNIDLRRQSVQVEQRLNFRVEHEPLTSMTLNLPKSLLNETHLELFLDGHDLPALPVSSVSENDTQSRVDVPFSSPRSGAFEVVARFALAKNSSGAETGEPFTVPLITPSGIALDYHRVTVQSESAMRIQSIGDAWEVAEEPLTSVADLRSPALRFKATRPTSEIALMVRPEEARNMSATIVERAWFQTWLSGAIRQERAVYQFTTTQDELELKLPQAVPPTNIEVRLDRRLLAMPESNDLKISVPPTGAEHAHILEIRYQLDDTASRSNAIDVDLPRLPAGTWIKRCYWQLVLPGDEHLINSPAALTPEFIWSWSGWGWARHNSWDQADLESWVGATRQDPLPLATNRYLFSAAGNPVRFVVRTAARWQIVLCASSVALVLGLLLLQIPVIRKPWILLTLGVALLALSIWLPEAAIMFSQAAVLGLVLLLFGAFLQRLVARRRTKTGFVHPTTESSILDRSNSPTRVRSMSLAGASTTTGPGEIQLPPTQSQDG